MFENMRAPVAAVMCGLVLLTALAGSPQAAASTNVNATGGSGTSVDRDGTQGSFGDSVQGKADDDGDQDAYLIGSEEAAPQVKATPK